MRKDKSDHILLETTLNQFKDCIPVFSVLTDENRQKIIVELATNDYLNVTQITERLVLSRPAVSHHLKNLKQAGLVAVEKRGTENFYYLTLNESITHMKQLIKLIEATCYLR